MATANMLPSLCGGEHKNEREKNIAALIEGFPQILTSPQQVTLQTQDAVSEILDDFLERRGKFDFGRGFDMKSTLESIINRLSNAGWKAAYKYPKHEMIALVLWFFDILFPSLGKINEFATNVARSPVMAINIEIEEPSFHEEAVLTYGVRSSASSKGYAEIRWMYNSWKRRRAFLGSVIFDDRAWANDPEMTIPHVVAELLAVDLEDAWKERGELQHGFPESSSSIEEEYRKLGILHEEVEGYNDQFKLLRGDLDKLCPEDFDDYLRIINTTMKALGEENINQEYWNSPDWDENDLTNSHSDLKVHSHVNVLQGLEDSIDMLKCQSLWRKKRLAIWLKLRNSFDDLIEEITNSGAVARLLGKGMLFLMCMGKPRRFRGIDQEIFEELCSTFSDRIPELRMIEDEVMSRIAVPGLDTEYFRITSANPEKLNEGIEHVRGFYERLVQGGLRSADLTPYAVSIYVTPDKELLLRAFDEKQKLRIGASAVPPVQISQQAEGSKEKSKKRSFAEISSTQARNSQVPQKSTNKKQAGRSSQFGSKHSKISLENEIEDRSSRRSSAKLSNAPIAEVGGESQVIVCNNCGETRGKIHKKGDCKTCHEYFRRTGIRRPEYLWKVIQDRNARRDTTATDEEAENGPTEERRPLDTSTPSSQQNIGSVLSQTEVSNEVTKSKICVNCEIPERKIHSKQRCGSCYAFFQQNGVERPRSSMRKTRKHDTAKVVVGYDSDDEDDEVIVGPDHLSNSNHRIDEPHSEIDKEITGQRQEGQNQAAIEQSGSNSKGHNDEQERVCSRCKNDLTGKPMTKGRCHRCYTIWQNTGVERSETLFWPENIRRRLSAKAREKRNEETEAGVEEVGKKQKDKGRNCSRCVVCKAVTKGRCMACNTYFSNHGVERPSEYFENNTLNAEGGDDDSVTEKDSAVEQDSDSDEDWDAEFAGQRPKSDFAPDRPGGREARRRASAAISKQIADSADFDL